MEGAEMIDARFVPVESWPGKETSNYERKSAPFRASYASTLDLLEKELAALRAKDITIQAYFQRKDIRNDGWPRSSAPKPSKPGVIVSFDVRKGAYINGKWVETVTEMSFPCDRFNSWEDNLRAIAKALEALRMVDRYGVTQSGEQYKGLARLAAPSTEMGVIEAAMFIAGFSSIPKDHILNGALEQAYRRAAAVLHPDAPGGSHEQFVRLQQAKAVLDKGGR